MSAKRTRPALLVYLEDTNRDQIQNKLTDNISEAEKNRLYQAFLEDTIYTCLNLPGTVLRINYPSEESCRMVQDALDNLGRRLPTRLQKALTGDNFALVHCRGASEGERIKAAFTSAFAENLCPAVLIGCVTPTLSRTVLVDAFQALTEHDAIIGPTLEGSFYLIGLTRLVPELFDGIDWSVEENVYGQLVRSVSDHALGWHELDLWYDLRQAEDFEFLVRDINFLRQIGDETSAACTEQVLDEIFNRMS